METHPTPSHGSSETQPQPGIDKLNFLFIKKMPEHTHSHRKHNPTSKFIPLHEYKYKIRTESSPHHSAPRVTAEPLGHFLLLCFFDTHIFASHKLCSQNGAVGLELVFNLNSPPQMSLAQNTHATLPCPIKQLSFPCSATAGIFSLIPGGWYVLFPSNSCHKPHSNEHPCLHYHF